MLLSVGKLAERGLNVEIQRSSPTIWGAISAIATGTKIGNVYVLEKKHGLWNTPEQTVSGSFGTLAWDIQNESAMIKTQRSTNGMPVVGRGFKI
ncbi:polyprotein [Phytophthora megakarya]|uniref:Polyprotein n=1 Tax=Phytophthora megakarya TaxID=4795 RepID=A0A225VS93_9STRA|nr:polyprotein [Phytophthora megakarya]